MMLSSSFKSRGWPFPPKAPATLSTYTTRPRAAAVAVYDGKARAHVAVPKHNYFRDADYLRWVASLPCAHCRLEGYSQAAHSDDNGAGGKGMGIKASDDTAYPACAPRPGDPGCHWRIGTSGTWSKRERHALEADYAAQTRALWKQMFMAEAEKRS